MNNSNKNEAIEVVYDAMENKSYEFLSEAVINANIGNKKLSSSDTILKILPVRFCEGKKPNNNAEIGFNISEICRTPSELTEKIVIFVDGERLEVNAIRDYIQEKQKLYFSPEQIIGLDPGAQLDSETRTIDFLLQPEDIKRIAEAKDVGVYIDSNDLHDANGGDIQFRGDNGSFQIEGIQGVMKRAYHYFVDETCYADYCESFLERKQKLVAEEKKYIKEETQRLVQELKQNAENNKQAKEEVVKNWYKQRNKYLIILAASIGLGIILGILEDSVELPWWTTFVPGIGFIYSTFELFSIGAIGGGKDDGAGGEG